MSAANPTASVIVPGARNLFASASVALPIADALTKNMPPLGGDGFSQAEIDRATMKQSWRGADQFFTEFAPEMFGGTEQLSAIQTRKPCRTLDGIPSIPLVFKTLEHDQRRIATRVYHDMLAVLHGIDVLPTTAWFDLEGGLLVYADRDAKMIRGVFAGMMSVMHNVGIRVGLISDAAREEIDSFTRIQPFLSSLLRADDSQSLLIMDRYDVLRTAQRLADSVPGIVVMDDEFPTGEFYGIAKEGLRRPAFAQVPPLLASGEVYFSVRPSSYDFLIEATLMFLNASDARPDDAQALNLMKVLRISKQNTYQMMRREWGVAEVERLSSFLSEMFVEGMIPAGRAQESARPRRAITPQPMKAIRAKLHP